MPKKKLGSIPTVSVGLVAPAFYLFGFRPIPKERPMVHMRNGRAIAMTKPRTRAYEAEIREASALQHPATVPWERSLTIFINFYFLTKVHGDLDNLAKAILDGVQGVVFKNDKQIKALHLQINYIDEGMERSEMIVQAFNEDERRTQIPQTTGVDVRPGADPVVGSEAAGSASCSLRADRRIATQRNRRPDHAALSDRPNMGAGS